MIKTIKLRLLALVGTGALHECQISILSADVSVIRFIMMKCSVVKCSVVKCHAV